MADKYPTLKIGIAGAGLMGHWHAKSAQRLGTEIIAVVDQVLSRAKKLSAGLDGNPAVFTNIEEMLARSKPHILHICTPLESHYPVAMQSVERGVHAVIEKPVTATASETRALLQAARENGVGICPVHQVGFQHGVQKAVRELESLGELLEMRFTACSAGGQGQANSDLNRIIMDIIPHPLSVMQKLRPGIEFDTSVWQGVQPRKGELQLIGGVNGVVIDISISMNARPTRFEMELFCSKGRVFLNFFHGYAVIEKGRVSRAQKLLQPFKYAVRELFLAGRNAARRGLSGELAYPGLRQLMALFYQSVVAGTQSPISAEDMIAVATARDELISRFLEDSVAVD
jgi:predicted dehydrogenase